MPDPRRRNVVPVKLNEEELAWVKARATPGARATWENNHPPSRSGLLRMLVRLAMKDSELDRRLMAAIGKDRVDA